MIKDFLATIGIIIFLGAVLITASFKMKNVSVGIVEFPTFVICDPYVDAYDNRIYNMMDTPLYNPDLPKPKFFTPKPQNPTINN